MFKSIVIICILLLTESYGMSISSYSKDSQWTPQLDGRIVGGREVSIIKHPHQCSMRYRSCLACAFSHICGASIYTESIVITAAHCVRGRDATNFLIVCGTENRSGADGAIVPVEYITSHEDYNITSYDNDVALMFLNIPLPINNLTITPIALAENQPENGIKSQVTGWGTTTESGFTSGKLLEVDVPIVSNELCNEAYGEDRITLAMLCAGVIGGGKDACQGDSGGPLVVQNQLAGIVSWGRGCARPDFPGVYASVSYLKKWIENAALRPKLMESRTLYNSHQTRPNSAIDRNKITVMPRNGKQRVRRRSSNRWSSFQAKEDNSTLGNLNSSRRQSGSGAGRSQTSDNRIDVPEITTFLDDTYREVLEKFRRLRERMSNTQPENIKPINDRCLTKNDDSDFDDCSCSCQPICNGGRGTEKITTTKIGGINCDYVQETVIQRSMLVGNNIQTTSRHIIKRCDKNGHIEVEVKESKHMCGAEQFGTTSPYFDELTEGRQSSGTQQSNDMSNSKNFQINTNLEKSFGNSESTKTNATSVNVTTSLTKISTKPISKSQARSSAAGTRVRYEEDLENPSVPSLPQTEFTADHKPLDCCKCICDFCSSRIAQQLLLDQLDQQTLNELIKRRNIEGRQSENDDYYAVGELAQPTVRSHEEKDYVLPTKGNGQTVAQQCKCSKENRSSFCDKQPRNSMVLPPTEYAPDIINKKPLPEENFSYSPYYEDTQNLHDWQQYPNDDDQGYYTASDAMAANQYYQNEPRYSERLEHENEMSEPYMYRQSLNDRAYPNERIDEISPPSYPSFTSLRPSPSFNQIQSVPRQPPKLSLARLASSRQKASFCPPQASAKQRQRHSLEKSKDFASREDTNPREKYAPAYQNQSTNTSDKNLQRTKKDKCDCQKTSRSKNISARYKNVPCVTREISVQTRVRGLCSRECGTNTMRCNCQNKSTSTQEHFPTERIADISRPSFDSTSDTHINAHHNNSCCSSATIISARTVNSKIIAEILIPNNFDCELLVESNDDNSSCDCDDCKCERKEKNAASDFDRDDDDDEAAETEAEDVVIATSVQSINNSDIDLVRVSSEVQIRQRQRSITFAGDEESNENENENATEEKEMESKAKDDDETAENAENDGNRGSVIQEFFSRQRELSNAMMRKSSSRSSNSSKAPNKNQKSNQSNQRRSSNYKQKRISQKQISRIPRLVRNSGNSSQQRPSYSRPSCSQPNCTIVCCDCLPICPFSVDPCCPRPPVCRRKP